MYIFDSIMDLVISDIEGGVAVASRFFPEHREITPDGTLRTTLSCSTAHFTPSPGPAGVRRGPQGRGRS